MDIRRGSTEQECQVTVALLTTAIFGDLGGYFFRNVEIRPAILHGDWRYANPCRPVIDCKINDLE